MLNTAGKDLSQEICRNHMRLARKYYPGKWNENYKFTKEVSESIFKNVANVHKILKE